MIFDIIQIENPISLFFLSLSATRYDPVADSNTAIIFAISNGSILFLVMTALFLVMDPDLQLGTRDVLVARGCGQDVTIFISMKKVNLSSSRALNILGVIGHTVHAKVVDMSSSLRLVY
jgi:hypothetical protein